VNHVVGVAKAEFFKSNILHSLIRRIDITAVRPIQMASEQCGALQTDPKPPSRLGHLRSDQKHRPGSGVSVSLTAGYKTEEVV